MKVRGKKFLFLFCACVGVSAQVALAQGGGMGQGGPQAGAFCPAAQSNLTLAYNEVPEGAALVFTGSADELAKAKPQMEAMAAKHSSMWSSSDSAARPQKGRMMGFDGQKMQPSTAKVVSGVGNLQIVFEPRDAKDLKALREAVRAHSTQMAAGCMRGAGR